MAARRPSRLIRPATAALAALGALALPPASDRPFAGAAPPETLTAAAAPTSSLRAATVAADEAYWISLAQVPDGLGPASGAIARHPLTTEHSPAFVSPYDGTIGARGLLLGGTRYHPMVRAWIDWYFRNLNERDHNGVSGTIHDHWVDPSSGQQWFAIDPATGKPSYDSTDAYAGVFLSLLRAYAEQVPADHGYLRDRRDLIERIALAAVTTEHPSGLTGARPDWYGEYLLDNIDTAQGLADYAWLARNVLRDTGLADRWARKAAGIRSAVESLLWFPDRGMYGWASDQPNPRWDVFYPDAEVQAWPIIHRYGSAERRRDLFAGFDAAWPRWVTGVDNPGTSFPQPWPTLAMAAAVTGRRDQVVAYLESTQRTWVTQGRPWPWSVNDSYWRAATARHAQAAGWIA